jgi:predicted RNA-binding Zn-ribbon protein involved in translation (DUF1610 family)
LEFHPGRILGIVLGLVILATIFLLPFGTSDTRTLYGVVGPLLSNPGGVQSSGGAASITYGYIFIIAFILIVIAGLVGIFPLGTGVLGVVGMAMITVAPYLVYPSGPVKLDPGTGFYVIWGASIASLGASFWHRKKKEAAPVNVNVTQTQTMGAPAQTAQVGQSEVKCPNCGTMNLSSAARCRSCGKDLPKSP